MPAIGSISIADAQTTPVTHVFSPVTTDGNVAKYANRAGSTPATFETLSLEMRSPSSPTGAYRLIGKMNDPVEATVNGSVVAVRNNSLEFTFNFSQQSTAQERLDDLKMVSNLLNNATVIAMAQNVEPIY